ncbi:ABC transporter ATP-binding protein [Variovorax sp. GB1P17]|uniref:ABC transporter ATP-binding protein n=1 Tax=Variovorax sp. GB1P17 TaxID=3443740 RepID=UPI003F48E6BE
MSHLLKVSALSAWYGQSKVLHDLSLRVDQGTVTVLLGANGAGKTTTLRAICSMVRRQGTVVLDGVDLTGRSTEDVARRGVAHVPDGRGTFKELSVLENLRLGSITRRDKAMAERDMEDVLQYFPRLKERLGQQAGTLSGGEQQMLAIGRALMLRPTLMLLDEPSFGLAPLVVNEIYEIIRRICKERGVSVLLVEQNAKIALEVGQYGYLLESGEIAAHGPSDVLRSDEAIQRSYLGH